MDTATSFHSSEGANRVKEKARPYYLYDPANDTVAVLVHGFTSSPYDMRELGDFLFSKGINIYGALVAGHGSNSEALVQTSHIDWTKSIEDAVSIVESSHTRVFLVGYSFGSNLVLDLASRYPDHFSGIVCLGISIRLRMNGLEIGTLRYFNRVLRFFGFKKWRKSYVPRDTVEVFESTGSYAHIPLKSMIDWHDFIRTKTRKRLSAIRTPILLIHSRGDRISHPESSEIVFNGVSSAYREFFILPEFGHNPLVSDHRKSVFRRVLYFIES